MVHREGEMTIRIIDQNLLIESMARPRKKQDILSRHGLTNDCACIVLHRARSLARSVNADSKIATAKIPLAAQTSSIVGRITRFSIVACGD